MAKEVPRVRELRHATQQWIWIDRESKVNGIALVLVSHLECTSRAH